MASDESFTNYVAEQQRHIQRFSCRKMFDEYATCSGDKAIALICENQMFVLPTAGGRAVLGAPRLGPPSPGATPHVLIGGELEDAELMARLIAATAADIEARQFVDEGQADGERRKGKPDKPGQGEAAVVMHDLLHRIRPMRSLIVALALAGPALAFGQRTVATAELPNPPAGEWIHHGRTYDNQRFSPLAQVTRANVAQLGVTAVYQLNVQRADGLETTPIIAGGVMYVTTSHNSVLAYDLRTHKRLWQYDHERGPREVYCCGPVNRGVAIAGDKVFMATLDARLVALDAKTGAVKWNIVTHPADSGYSHTSAPLIVGNKVIVGIAGGEYGIRGSVTAYDTESGRQLWRFYTIPSPAEGGWWGKYAPATPWGDKLPRDMANEHADSAKYADTWKIGGSPVWVTPAYDPELGLIYFGTGNPSPSNNGAERPGDNLYNNSTVALDVETGKIRWYVQHIPHDLWDYDIPNPPILARVGGRKVVMHAGKDGWMYVMDAATGATIRRSDAFVPQENMWVKPDVKGILMRPGIFGGANWPPSSFSPQTGLMYIPARDRANMATVNESAEFEAGKLFTGGSFPAIRDRPPTGLLAAVDPSTGKVKWQATTPTWTWSGTLATAGGLVFMGESNGWIRAYDATDGKVLWSFFCGAGVDGSPVTYELDGRQYIAVPAGGIRYAQLKGNAILVFALPSTGR